MSGEDTDSDTGRRSERLRQRRAQRDPADGSAERAEPDDTQTSKPADRAEPAEPTVKEEQVGTYMYLPESQKKEVERLYNVLKAEYEYEYDETFEKNRHYYPILIQHGLDELDGLDPAEIRARLDAL